MRIKKWYYQHFYMIIFMVSAIVAGAMFITYAYEDMKALTVWSLNLLDVLYEGRLLDFYSYCAENKYNLDCATMGSGYIGLIPWAIWNIPVWVLQRWFGYAAIGHAWTLLYSKLFLIFIEGIVLFYAYKITIHITENKEKGGIAAYLAFSAPFAFIAVFYTGQSDIISICFFTIAIYKLLQKKRLWFILLAAVSIAVKPYVLLPFLAVVLLTEKNIWKIILNFVGGGSIQIVFNFLYKDAPMFKESMQGGPVEKQINALLCATIDGGIGRQISILIVILVLFYFFLYLRKWTEGKQGELEIIFVVAASFLFFLMFSDSEFYRMVYMMPFLYILFVSKKNVFELNLLLEIIASISGIIVFYWKKMDFFCNWFVMQYIRDMLPEKRNLVLDSVRQIGAEKMPLDSPVCLIAASIYFVSLLLLLIVNCPFYTLCFENKMKIGSKTLLWIRALVMVPFIVLSLYGG